MKKLAKLFLLVLVFAFVSSVLVACGEDKTTTHVHAFGEWKVITNPTCTETGLKVRYCECGEEETEEIKALGHNYVNGVCSRCGLKELKETEGLVFELQEDDTYAVTGYMGSDKEVVILSAYDGKAVKSIGRSAFYKCSSLTSITIPDSVMSIGNSAFSNCSSLTSVTIGNGVTSIGDEAFEDCSSLTSITIPDSVTSIGYEAFVGCSSLTSITIPDSVTSIEDGAFYECRSLTSVYYTGDIASWCGIAFDYYSNPLYCAHNLYINNKLIKDIVIPDTVTEIKAFAFEDWNGMSITIPDSVTSIGEDAFLNCSSLTSITIGNGVTSIGDYAFNNCPVKTATISTLAISCIPKGNLKTVVITSGESIGDDAFYNCSSLTSVTIGNSVTSIGDCAFFYCSSLTSITIPDSVTSIGNSAFSNCSSLTSITIPNSVTSIGNRAFSSCSSLTSVYYTGDIASWCGITFGNSSSNPLIYVHNLYIDNELIKDIVIPDSATEIKANAFRGWNGTSITLGNSVTSIGGGAFCDCRSLTSITIPDSVTSIGNDAFEYCYGLTSITFQGTKAQWNEIIKGSDWNYGTGNYTVHCTDGDITMSDTGGHIHSFGDWQTVSNPTCTETGLKVRYCECGEEETEEIKAKGHTEVIDEAVAPTCTETGLTEGKHCSVCKEILVAQEVVPALGHDIIHHEGKEPTCTEEGYKAYDTCSRCDYTTYEEIEAKAVPVVEIASPTKTQTSVGFAINETDADNVGAVTKIELIHANGTVVADSIDVREFTGLLSDNTYTVKVTYAYDLNDGVGSQEIVKTLDIKTEPKTVPYSEINNIEQLKNNISGGFDVFDCDNTILRSNLSISNFNGEIDNLESTFDFDFDGLNCFQCEYVISLTLAYDINDGKGEQEAKTSHTVTTLVAYTLLDDDTYSVTGLTNPRISEIDLPETYCGKVVSNIGRDAFCNSNISSASLPDTIKTIEDGAFKNCQNLDSINMPIAIRHIGVDAFNGCDKIVNYIKDNVVSDITYSDTTKWYMLKNDIQVKQGASLSISPNVILLGNGCNIVNYGTLNIVGEKSCGITLFNVNLLSKNAGNTINNFNLRYVSLHVGQFSPPTGNSQSSNINIQNCKFYDSTDQTHIWYPEDCIIKNCYFESWELISIGTSNDVSIMYNTFVNCGSNYSVIDCWAAYREPITVQYNNFIDSKGYALSLGGSSRMDARYNWFGTSDEDKIKDLIWDGNDDFSIPNTIDYSNYLTEKYQSE